MNNTLIKHGTVIGLIIVTWLTLLIALMFYRQGNIVMHAKNLVLQSHEVTAQIQSLLNQLKDAELGQRGYILTNNEKFLEPYISAITPTKSPSQHSNQHRSIEQRIELLEGLISESITQRQHFNELKKNSTALLEYWAYTVLLQKNNRPESASDASLMQGKELMDSVRANLNAMLEEEHNRLITRTQADEQSTEKNHLITLIGIAIFYTGMVLAVWFATRHWKRAKEMEEEIYNRAKELAEANGKLQNAVQELARLNETIKTTGEVRLDAVLNNVIDGIITINEKGNIESFNRACEQIFGYTADEVMGKNLKMLMPEPYHSEHDGYLSHYVKTGDAHIIGTAGREVRAKRKDGSIFPIDLSVSAFELEDGRHFSGIIRDITEKKKLLANLTGQMNAINKVQAVIEFNMQGTILTANDNFLSMMGYTLDEIQGKHHRIFVDISQQNEQSYEEFWNRLRNGEYQVAEYKRIGKDNREVWIQGSYNPILDENGKPYKVVKFATNITIRKESEIQIQRYMNELERSNQELDDFAYIASHDLKEPLRGLFNHASFLLEDYKEKLDDDGIHRLNRLAQLAQRMERLVNDLLYFSRLGRTELAVQETDPNEMVHEIQQMMELFLKERNAHITIPKPMPKITCDKPRITEVLRNLITNAAKYNDKSERIVEVGFIEKMNTAQGEEKNVFYVKDNGVGIEPEFHQEIFRIFKRLQRNTEDQEGGTGAGLTFVKKIVERHQGRIWLESKPTIGTTFYFNLNRGASQ